MYLWHSHDDWDEVKTRELTRVKTMVELRLRQSWGNSEVSGVKGVNECILHRFSSDLPSHYARSAMI